MPKNLQAVLAELQPLVQQISDANEGAVESQPVESEISTIEPEPAPVSNVSSDLPIKNIKAAGLTISLGVDKDSPLELERIEVGPEPDGSFRITVRAKRKEPR